MKERVKEREKERKRERERESEREREREGKREIERENLYTVKHVYKGHPWPRNIDGPSVKVFQSKNIRQVADVQLWPLTQV